MKQPRVPAEIIEEIGLKEPISLKKTAPLLYDTKQYSIKIPAGIIEEVNWSAGDTIDIEIESDGLKLRKAKAD